ncbi:MAG: hypothetical protein ACTSUG_13930 [Candidatus Helarchaeota archaeon]
MIKKIKNIFLKNKQIILSLLLFSIVFYLLGLQFKNWWLWEHDDFHIVYELGYKTQGWSFKKILYHFFSDGDAAHKVDVIYEKNFFSSLYRPLACVIYSLTYPLFKLSKYYYLIGGALFHSINTILLFNIFLFFINYFFAFLFALIFAFHPIVTSSFGYICTFVSTIPITLILLTLLLFKAFLDKKRWYLYSIGIFFFAISLLIREIFLPLPFIMFIGAYFYKNKYNELSLKDFIKKLSQNLKLILPFLGISLGFVLLKAYFHPIIFSESKNVFSIIPSLTIIKKNIYFIYFMIKDFFYSSFGISLIPSSYSFNIIRLILVFSISLTLLLLFLKNTKKIYVLFLLATTLLMLWPLPLIKRLGHHYLYEPLPFLLLTIILFFKYYKESFKKIKTLGYSLLTIITISFITFSTNVFSEREKIMKTCSQAIIKLTKNPIIKDKKLYFIGLPSEYFCAAGNIENLFKILLDNQNAPIFIDYSTMSILSKPYLKMLPASKKLLSKYSPLQLIKSDCIKTKLIDEKIRLKSTNSKKAFFQVNKNNNFIGKKTIHKIEIVKGRELTTDLTIQINPEHINKDSIFVTWNYKKAEFKILDIKTKDLV